jgi:hypothetical protein
MTSLRLFASLVLTATAVSTLSAETRCPGNAASLPLRMVNSHQTIVAVSVNHAGPFNFMLDTGTQMTMLDPKLAATLKLTTSGTAEVESVAVSASAAFAQVELIEVGSRWAANQRVLVYDLRNLQTTGLDIQGVLGEDFLEQFDMLIDNGHSILCLGAAGTMQAEVKGQHVALVEPKGGDSTLAHSLIVTAQADRRDAAGSAEAGFGRERLVPLQHGRLYGAGVVPRCDAARRRSKRGAADVYRFTGAAGEDRVGWDQQCEVHHAGGSAERFADVGLRWAADDGVVQAGDD